MSLCLYVTLPPAFPGPPTQRFPPRQFDWSRVYNVRFDL